MAICKDCGCSFSDIGNMPFCIDCIEKREEKIRNEAKRPCDETKNGIGITAQNDFDLHQKKLNEFFNTQAEDSWIHRSSGMRCKTCMWFVHKTVPVGAKTIGRCRRHAPSMNGYPVVYENDWCGDHKVDETKI